VPERLRPSLVTLTAGGNDAHFGDVMEFCLTHIRCHEEAEYSGLADEISALRTPLKNLYQAAKDRANGANAKVIVFGYPQLFGPEADNDCLSDLSMEQSERVWTRQMISHMNDVIQSAADEVGVMVIHLQGRFRTEDFRHNPARSTGTKFVAARIM
jgi:hypothetical protein